MIRSGKALEGLPIHATDGAIGKIKDTYFNDEQWVVRYVVVDTGKWLENREVLIASTQLRPTEPEASGLRVDATKEQVRNSPPAESDRPVSRQHEQRLHDYFGWPYYWGAATYIGTGIPLAVPTMVPTMPAAGPEPERARPAGESAAAVAEEQEKEGDPHLRSVREIRGSRLGARDGAIGHVDDLLLDEQAWTVRYLVIDTRNWWPGKKVLLSPRWISRVHWADQEVAVGLTREDIRNAPEYESSRSPSEPYLAALDAYYRHIARRTS